MNKRLCHAEVVLSMLAPQEDSFLSSVMMAVVFFTCSLAADLLEHCTIGEATLFRVGGDGGAHAVGADSLNGSGHGELLQAPFEVAVLSLQLLLRV